MKWSLIITAIRIGWREYQRLRDVRGARIASDYADAADEHETERAQYRRGRVERRKKVGYE